MQTVLLSNAEQGEAAAVPKATKRPALASNAAILKVNDYTHLNGYEDMRFCPIRLIPGLQGNLGTAST